MISQFVCKVTADSSLVTMPHTIILTCPLFRSLQWAAADSEIKVPSVENTELKVLPLKPGVGQYITIHAMPTARESFLANF